VRPAHPRDVGPSASHLIPMIPTRSATRTAGSTASGADGDGRGDAVGPRRGPRDEVEAVPVPEPEQDLDRRCVPQTRSVAGLPAPPGTLSRRMGAGQAGAGTTAAGAGPVGIITGGASGIGAASAVAFAGLGARLVLATLPTSPTRAVTALVERAGGQ